MQITLVQSEIEQALKNYINEQVNVKEGMEITIAFKATRGEEGNTAVIDIVPSTVKPVAPATPTKRAAPAKVEPKVEAPKEEPKPADPPFEPDPKPETGNQEAASVQESSASTAGAAAVPQNAETASAEAAPRRPSLFGNLGQAKSAQ